MTTDPLFDFSGQKVLVTGGSRGSPERWSSPLAPSSLKTPEALFDKVVARNFKAPFRLMSLVGTCMEACAGGSIVNISSTGAIRPRP